MMFQSLLTGQVYGSSSAWKKSSQALSHATGSNADGLNLKSSGKNLLHEQVGINKVRYSACSASGGLFFTMAHDNEKGCDSPLRQREEVDEVKNVSCESSRLSSKNILDSQPNKSSGAKSPRMMKSLLTGNLFQLNLPDSDQRNDGDLQACHQVKIEPGAEIHGDNPESRESLCGSHIDIHKQSDIKNGRKKKKSSKSKNKKVKSKCKQHIESDSTDTIIEKKHKVELKFGNHLYSIEQAPDASVTLSLESEHCEDETHAGSDCSQVSDFISEVAAVHNFEDKKLNRNSKNKDETEGSNGCHNSGNTKQDDQNKCTCITGSNCIKSADVKPGHSLLKSVSHDLGHASCKMKPTSMGQEKQVKTSSPKHVSGCDKSGSPRGGAKKLLVMQSLLTGEVVLEVRPNHAEIPVTKPEISALRQQAKCFQNSMKVKSLTATRTADSKGMLCSPSSIPVSEGCFDDKIPLSFPIKQEIQFEDQYDPTVVCSAPNNGQSVFPELEPTQETFHQKQSERLELNTNSVSADFPSLGVPLCRSSSPHTPDISVTRVETNRRIGHWQVKNMTSEALQCGGQLKINHSKTYLPYSMDEHASVNRHLAGFNKKQRTTASMADTIIEPVEHVKETHLENADSRCFDTNNHRCKDRKKSKTCKRGHDKHDKQADMLKKKSRGIQLKESSILKAQSKAKHIKLDKTDENNVDCGLEDAEKVLVPSEPEITCMRSLLTGEVIVHVKPSGAEKKICSPEKNMTCSEWDVDSDSKLIRQPHTTCSKKREKIEKIKKSIFDSDFRIQRLTSKRKRSLSLSQSVGSKAKLKYILPKYNDPVDAGSELGFHGIQSVHVPAEQMEHLMIPMGDMDTDSKVLDLSLPKSGIDMRPALDLSIPKSVPDLVDSHLSSSPIDRKTLACQKPVDNDEFQDDVVELSSCESGRHVSKRKLWKMQYCPRRIIIRSRSLEPSKLSQIRNAGSDSEGAASEID